MNFSERNRIAEFMGRAEKQWHRKMQTIWPDETNILINYYAHENPESWYQVYLPKRQNTQIGLPWRLC